jgi:hypothetical protein
LEKHPVAIERLDLGAAGLLGDWRQRRVHRRGRGGGLRRARLDLSDRQRASRGGGFIRLRDRDALPGCRGGRHGAALHRAVLRGPAAPEQRQAIDGDMPADGARFTSQESYFPVFDSSVKDLQALEADVVDNATAFYTYMKVMRDSLRKLAEIHPSTGTGRVDGWHRAICNVVYMQFLGLESARKAINDLVEFEPTRAENTFTILLSELVAYAFLREQFTGDLKQRRLEARDEHYRREIPDLYDELQQRTGKQWDKAKDVAAEVMKRHAEIFTVDAAPPSRSPEWTFAEASVRPG